MQLVTPTSSAVTSRFPPGQPPLGVSRQAGVQGKRSMGNAPQSLAIAAPAPVDFPALYQAHFDYVWNSVRRLGVPQRDIEDVVHDVFLTVHRSLSSYDPERPIKPWLFGVAFRVVSDFRRKAQNVREVLEDEPQDTEDESASLDDQVTRREARELVVEALQGVELSRRAVFVMHELDGEAIPQVAEALGIPLNTAYSRLRLARQDFAAAVKRIRAQRGGA